MSNTQVQGVQHIPSKTDNQDRISAMNLYLLGQSKVVGEDTGCRPPITETYGHRCEKKMPQPVAL